MLTDIPGPPPEDAAPSNLVGGAIRLLRTRPPQRRKRRPGVALAVFWLALIILAAIFANVLPLSQALNPALTLETPAWLGVNIFSAHPLGTDSQGLDVFGQLIFGARVSLTVGVLAVLIAMVVGGVIGSVAGFLGGRLDHVVGFLTDTVMAFPPLLLLLALVTIIKPNLVTVSGALALLAAPGFLRLARANTIKLASRDYVVSARTLGASNVRLLTREILPGVAPSMLAYGLVSMGYLIVAEASLSFLGLGIARPTPTWGNMIAEGQEQLSTLPTLVWAPALALFLTVLSINYLGQRLQEKWGIA
jgi:peptide/nickel transport system permease protein